MSKTNLNLLLTLDALLSEGSVVRAARRLSLSPSAMSRALARLRRTTGDPLLARAGRGLILTPRALELRQPVSELVRGGQAVLQPAQRIEPARLARTFTLRSSEGFVEAFGPDLISRVQREAPGVGLRLVQKTDSDPAALRDGTVDLETGVVGEATSPELRAQALFRDRFIGVVRKGHPLSRGRITPARYASASHIAIVRRGLDRGPVDAALQRLGLERRAMVAVSGFSTAVGLARVTDLVASVPERHTGWLRGGMHSFTLPVATKEITVSMLWHPRMDADPAHRWLRECVRDVCAAALVDAR